MLKNYNIISQGKRPEDRIWRGMCCHCGSVIEVKRKELGEPQPIMYGNSLHIPEDCPICGKVRGINFYKKGR